MSKKISQKKIDANQRNAQKSTGPRTASGKARSSMNSLKYSLNASKFIIKDELVEEFVGEFPSREEVYRQLDNELAISAQLRGIIYQSKGYRFYELN